MGPQHFLHSQDRAGEALSQLPQGSAHVHSPLASVSTEKLDDHLLLEVRHKPSTGALRLQSAGILAFLQRPKSLSQRGMAWP